ncbi:MAG TPA: DUF1836 domain-containing protein [Candidatus Butyricicoccus stercorigallinarum]|nr:DUF1836 domain-containing protein [Candidatus Butyricicoccus stercorigallinarum]
MGIDAHELLKNSEKTRALHPDDIPALDLYMDQIIALMRTHLGGEDEREPLTRTMIHNYSKAGLIAPVKGKKYSKEHILQMLAIYSLKNTLSIAQIKRVLNGAADCGLHEEELARCFVRQLERRDAIGRESRDYILRIMRETGMSLDSPEDALSFLLTLTDLADMLSSVASAITEQCFPEPEDAKKKPPKKTKKTAADP